LRLRQRSVATGERNNFLERRCKFKTLRPKHIVALLDVVGVLRPGRGNFVYASGLGDLATGAPISPADHVRIASIHQVFHRHGDPSTRRSGLFELRLTAGPICSRHPAQYFTQYDIREIVVYSADRFIAIVQEIEMPSHAAATLACYPQYGNSDIPNYHPRLELPAELIPRERARSDPPGFRGCLTESAKPRAARSARLPLRPASPSVRLV